MIFYKSERDGVKTNMTVIADKGLVGHVISVTETTSKVQTIVDPASSVSCTISSSKDGIIAKGTLEGTSQLKATYIPTDTKIENKQINVCDLLVELNIASSRSDAKRKIEGKGIKIDAELQLDVNEVIDFSNGAKVVQFGKSKFIKVK